MGRGGFEGIFIDAGEMGSAEKALSAGALPSSRY